MIRVNPFTGELQLVNESDGGGLPTALYDADGSVAASVDDIGNVVFVNGFSSTGNFYGDLDFDGGVITGRCDIDITGRVTTSGGADFGGDIEAHRDVYFDGDGYFANSAINADGSANFAGGLVQIDSLGTLYLGGGLSNIDLAGNMTMGGDTFLQGLLVLTGIPTGDPHNAGQIYQDATTHALYISQG